jgi:hypothetical protein
MTYQISQRRFKARFSKKKVSLKCQQLKNSKDINLIRYQKICLTYLCDRFLFVKYLHRQIEMKLKAVFLEQTTDHGHTMAKSIFGYKGLVFF